MIDDPDVAKQISELMMDMFTRLSDSCDAVREHCSQEEYAAYIKGTSKIAGGIVFGVMEPLYKKHPNLKPANWDESDESVWKSN